MQKLLDSSKLEGLREGETQGEIKGALNAKRDTLLRLLARSGIRLSEEESARVRSCTDASVLDRWVDNVLGAKTAAKVLSRHKRAPALAGPSSRARGKCARAEGRLPGAGGRARMGPP